jgi:RimJ/RimL family protein N-acetyltransferase
VEQLTERLRLRLWRDADLGPLAAMDGDPEVMRYIGDGSTRTREQVAGALARERERWRERGFGLFAVEVRETGEFGGWVGLAVPDFLPEEIISIADDRNQASLRVMAQLGMRPKHRTTVPRTGQSVQVTAITREEHAAVPGATG